MRSGIETWSNIRVFLAVRRAGSTLAAAKELGVSQATVARRVEALEHELGLELFSRDTRGSHPTEDGVRLAEAAENFERAWMVFGETAEGLALDKSDKIRISAPGPIFSKAFSVILAAFSKKHPVADFSLLPSDQAVDVGAGDADIAVLFTRTIANESLICRKVGVERTTMFASEPYVALNGLPRGQDDWRGQAVIGISGGHLPAHVSAWIAERSAPEMIRTRCENITSLVAAIQMGKGMGPLPTTLGDGLDGVVRCFDPPEALDLPIWLAVNDAAYRRKIVKSFVSYLAPRLTAVLRG